MLTLRKTVFSLINQGFISICERIMHDIENQSMQLLSYIRQELLLIQSSVLYLQKMLFILR